MRMDFGSLTDRNAIEDDMTWEARDRCTTIFERLSKTAKLHGPRAAMTYQLTSSPKDKGETLTWDALLASVTQSANMFRDLGIGEDDVVAYILPNATETILTFLGGMVAGIVNPINPLLDPTQIGSILRDTNAKVVVTLKAFPKTDISQKVAKALEDAPNVETVLEIDLLRYLTPPKSWIVPLIRPKGSVAHTARVLDFTKTLANYPTDALSFTDGTTDRIAAYFHTGGTTGMPKIAQHTYSGMMYNGWLGDNLLLSETDNIMCPLPMFHVFACQVIMMSQLGSGAHAVFPTPAGYRGDGVFDNFWKLCERHKITFVIGVPTAFAALMQRPVDADISSVKTAFSGSSPLPVELFKRFEKASGVEIIEGYGLTEASCLVSCNPIGGEKKIGSVGIPFPYTDIKIIDHTSERAKLCKQGEIGEICVANPGVNVGNTYTDGLKNKGLYYRKNYLRTGDLGRIDEDGYLWITGRAKDLIIRGGHNIDPAEIEELLAGHPDIALAGAIGQPCEYSGELPCAYVELTQGATSTADDLLAYVKENMRERAATPKHIEILDELPKTAVGKIFKPDLRKRAMTRVFNETLAAEGLKARVSEVIDDKRRGLTVRFDPEHMSEDEELTKLMGRFTSPWEWAE